MKTLILSIFGILLMNLAFAQPEFYIRTQFQNFDGEDSTIFCPVTDPYLVCIRLDPDTGNIWFAGNRYKGYKQPLGKRYIYTDTNTHYRSNDTSSFIIDFITKWQNITMQLSWSHYMDLGKGDYGKVEISKDTGRTWINCFESPAKTVVHSIYKYEDDVLDTLANGDIVFTGTDVGFWDRIDLVYDFYEILPPDKVLVWDKVLVRFTFVTDSASSPNLGWAIDSLEVYTYPPLMDIQKNERNGLIKTYPNPASNRLQIESNQRNTSEFIEHLILFNALGQKVDEWFDVPSGFSIETGHYPNGMYFLRSSSAGYTGASSIVIQHE